MGLLPPLIGHRGARKEAPENTLASLTRAAELGAAWVEVDVKLSGDGRLILMHDDTLERTTDGEGAVADTSWEVLAALDAGSWFDARFAGERVPLLIEAIGRLAELSLGANIEIKPCPGREAETGRAVAEEVSVSWPVDLPAPVLSSFEEDSLAAARETAPDLPRGLLVGDLPDDWAERAAALQCATVHVGQRALTREQVAAVKAAGLPLMAWTSNEVDRARELWSWGVDAIATDDVALLAPIAPR
jgi:glycerophosphoryl diester phosphodiesterase